jgi:hypothetical protein
VLCFCVVFLRLAWHVLPVSLDCPFLIAPSIFSNVYFPVSLDYWLPLRYSLTFIHHINIAMIQNTWIKLEPPTKQIGVKTNRTSLTLTIEAYTTKRNLKHKIHQMDGWKLHSFIFNYATLLVVRCTNKSLELNLSLFIIIEIYKQFHEFEIMSVTKYFTSYGVKIRNYYLKVNLIRKITFRHLIKIFIQIYCYLWDISNRWDFYIYILKL